MLNFRWFFFHAISPVFQKSCCSESAKKNMKTHQRIWESKIYLFRLYYSRLDLLFLFCLCVCKYIGFNVHNSLLSVVLGLKTSSHLSCEHLLALLRCEKVSPFNSLPLQLCGLSQLWSRKVHCVSRVHSEGVAAFVKLQSILCLQEMLCWTTVLADALEDNSPLEKESFTALGFGIFSFFLQWCIKI